MFGKEHPHIPAGLLEKARAIRLLLTDCDGVLTDNGVYYTDQGEAMKRFSIRDGMGVERLRTLAGVETGIMTGESSGSVVKRAEKLQIRHLYLGVKHKRSRLDEVLAETGLTAAEVAFIGDDTNDLEIMQAVGLSACPADATVFARETAQYICRENGGHGAFREFAELIVYSKTTT